METENLIIEENGALMEQGVCECGEEYIRSAHAVIGYEGVCNSCVSADTQLGNRV